MAKTKKQTKSKKEEEPLMKLCDLVPKLDMKYTEIIMRLSVTGLLDQYKNELENPSTAKPSITESEFKKLIGE